MHPFCQGFLDTLPARRAVLRGVAWIDQYGTTTGTFRTVPLGARLLPDERRQPGPIAVAVLLRQRRFEDPCTVGTVRFVQDYVGHVHLDVGQLQDLMCIVGSRLSKVPLSTGT